MKNTKCLFDEQNQTPAGMVSVSQIQTYLSCPKKWEYNYIENITPRVERAFLTIGKLCHKGMQVAMQTLWDFQQNNIDLDEDVTETVIMHTLYTKALQAIEGSFNIYMGEVPHLDEEIPDLEQMLVDARSVFIQALEEFDPLKYEVVSVVKDGKKVPALELHFVVPCAGSKGLHGYIDAILKDKETGFTWCTDYKFRKSLSPDDEEAYNIQNTVYCWACHKMGIQITGTQTWQHVNTPAVEPQVLKDGKMSRAKIKTTWGVYKAVCIRAGIDPNDYEEEMTSKLAEIEWYRATYEYRNLDTIKTIWNECVVPASRAISKAHNAKSKKYRSLYPWNCKMCQYQSLCQAELRGYDADAIRLREYTKREHSR
jgi:hypothetical protein